MDPKAVADVAHDRDSYLFLDAYRSLGVVPIDVQTRDIDILASGTLEFLFGGRGIAFPYVDEDIVTGLEPADLGWFSTDGKFEWEGPEYAADASRDWASSTTGTSSRRTPSTGRRTPDGTPHDPSTGQR